MRLYVMESPTDKLIPSLAEISKKIFDSCYKNEYEEIFWKYVIGENIISYSRLECIVLYKKTLCT